jgi:hypothetical protein
MLVLPPLDLPLFTFVNLNVGKLLKQIKRRESIFLIIIKVNHLKKFYVIIVESGATGTSCIVIVDITRTARFTKTKAEV